MHSKEKQQKMLYAVGTYDSSFEDSSRHSAQNVSAVTKRQFKLFMGDLNQHLKNDQVSLAPIEQEKSKTGHYQGTFVVKKEISIKKEEIMINFPFTCIQAANKITIPEEEIRRIITEFKKICQQDESEEEDNSEG